MFTPSKMLQKYLSAQPRDMYDIVGALMGYINADPYFKTNEFEDAIKYVLQNGVSEKELFQNFNLEYEFEKDEANWDDDYYAFSRVYLKDNFCKERIEHVKAVAHKLHPVAEVEIKEAEYIDVNGDNGEKELRDSETNGKKYQDHQVKTKQKKMPLVIMAVGVILLVVAIVSILKASMK